MTSLSDLHPDAVLKYVRNLKPGMETVEQGRVLAIEEHSPDYFNVTWDIEDGAGRKPATCSHGGWALLTVICNG